MCEVNYRSVACMDCRVNNSQNHECISFYLWDEEVQDYYDKPEDLEYCEHTPETDVVLYKSGMVRCEPCFQAGTIKYFKEKGLNLHEAKKHRVKVKEEEKKNDGVDDEGEECCSR